MMSEPSVDIEHNGMRILVRHLRHADGSLFAFSYSITDPTWGEVKSDDCYECGESFDEFVESCRRIVEAIIMNPYDWLDDDWFDECDRCNGEGSVGNVQGETIDCGPCRGRGRKLQK